MASRPCRQVQDAKKGTLTSNHTLYSVSLSNISQIFFTDVM
jgi:hypothetical protein